MRLELEQTFFDREDLMEKAKNFLDQHADGNGELSADDKKSYEEMEDRICNLTQIISREMALDNAYRAKNKQTPILYPEISTANNSGKKLVVNGQFGVVGKEYQREFLNQCRSGFQTAAMTLQTLNPASGGYLIPSEMHDEIVTALREENVMRQICRVIETASEHRIPIQATAPSAAFVNETQAITLSSETFDQKVLNAYKLACGISVSNEILADSFFDLEAHLVQEFSKAIGAVEENALLNGTGVNEPKGLLTEMSANSAMYQETVGANISADDLVNLVYSVPAPYRKNASFLVNDSTLAAIRKLKDSNLAYIWESALALGEPSSLLGFPIYSSEHMPSITSGNIAVLFGDFGKFIIGMRGNLQFKPLYELHALNDCTSYLMIERFDGVLTDSRAIRGLKIK